MIGIGFVVLIKLMLYFKYFEIILLDDWSGGLLDGVLNVLVLSNGNL